MTKALGIEEVVTARQSPWQNAYCERVIGSIRRECTDQIIAMGENHLRQVLNDYVRYYNSQRPHQSLGGNAPFPRRVETRGEVVSLHVLCGLRHTYSRAG